MHRIVMYLMIITVFFSRCMGGGEDNAETEMSDTASIVANIEEVINKVDSALVEKEENSMSGDPVIDSIRAEYQRIQSRKNLNEKIVDYTAKPGTEAKAVGVHGKLTFHTDNNKVVKVVDSGSEAHGTWNEEFYYRDGRLIYIFLNNANGDSTNPPANKYQMRVYIGPDGQIYKETTNRNKTMDVYERNRLLKKGKQIHKARTAAEILEWY